MRTTVYQNTDDFREQNAALGMAFPFSADTEVLKKELTIKGHKFANRLACQAMEGCDGEYDGRPGELTKRRYLRLAKGGAGLIWFEATACMPEGKANPRQLYINEQNIDDYKRIVENIKETGVRENGYEPVIILQATHSGRYSKPDGSPAPLIAYHNAILEQSGPLAESCVVTDDYLDRVREALVKEAMLGEKAGFDGVDIKACHRYLNSELLSAYERDGRYGGSYENRTRLLREGIRGAVESCGSSYIVSSRLNIYDGYPYPYGFGVSKQALSGFDPKVSPAEIDAPPFDPEEPIRLFTDLYNEGVRLLNVTMGNPYFNPHINRPYAAGGYKAPEHPLSGVARMLFGTERVKKAVPDMAILCSGLSFLGTAAPGVAAGFIERGGFDLAGFGRTILAYPDFAKDILTNGEMKKEKICIACSKCTEIMRCPGGTPGCVIRDREVYGPIYDELVKKG